MLELSGRTLILLMIAAYLFSVAMRMIWVYQFSDYEMFRWNDELMINTNDGYFFASAVQHYLDGTLGDNPRVPGLFFTAAITLSAMAVKIFSLPLESVVLYMPAVISGFVVIPVILIGRLLGSTTVGFMAALLGSIAWSYYNRTMVGYFDTDMFSAMAPMFILYFLLAMIRTENLKFALMGALAFLLYPYLYDQGRAVVYAMGLVYIAYMLFFHRRDDFTYHSILLISIGLLNLHMLGQFLAIAAAYIGMRKGIVKAQHSMYVSFVTVAAFLYFGNVFNLISGKVISYFSRGVEEEGLKYLQVKQTVREAGKIPFNIFADRISGSVAGFLAAAAGYVLLLVRRREMILSLPLVGIGVFALVGGLRFTVYAVPVAALSAVFLFSELGRLSEKRYVRFGVPLTLGTLMLIPNMMHIADYRVPTVMSRYEVQTLDALKKQSSEKDYVVTWWDYGYPVWFYANKNTLIDGGKHNRDNFIVSEILTTHSQLEAARLSRIAVETYVASGYQVVAETLFEKGANGVVNVSDYLEMLRYGDVKLPEKTREVYLYLPYRMLDILPTVRLFSNRDLNSGEEGSPGFFFISNSFKDEGNVLQLGSGVRLLKDRGMIDLGTQQVPIKRFIRTSYNADNVLEVQQQNLPGGTLNVIYLENYGRFVVLDDMFLQSTFVQMFLLEQYDKQLFEAVLVTPYSKIFRLKL